MRFGASDSLFDLDGFEHELLCPTVLLLRPQLNCNALHSTRLFILILGDGRVELPPQVALDVADEAGSL